MLWSCDLLMIVWPCPHNKENKDQNNQCVLKETLYLFSVIVYYCLRCFCKVCNFFSFIEKTPWVLFPHAVLTCNENTTEKNQTDLCGCALKFKYVNSFAFEFTNRIHGCGWRSWMLAYQSKSVYVFKFKNAAAKSARLILLGFHAKMVRGEKSLGGFSIKKKPSQSLQKLLEE